MSERSAPAEPSPDDERMPRPAASAPVRSLTTQEAVEAELAAARGRLAAAGVAEARLGVHRPGRRILGIGRADRVVPVGRAWHLGVLLLTRDGLAATGEIFRARHEAVRGVTSAGQRRRLDLAAAARRGGFGEGETVHLAWTPLDLDAAVRRGTAPLVATDAGVAVRWSPRGAPLPLAAYLAERVALAVDPPERA